jgi:hypothetical protein
MKTLNENKHFRDEESNRGTTAPVFLKTLHYNVVEALVNRLSRWNVLIVLYDVQVQYMMMQKHNRPTVYFGA